MLCAKQLIFDELIFILHHLNVTGIIVLVILIISFPITVELLGSDIFNSELLYFVTKLFYLILAWGSDKRFYIQWDFLLLGGKTTIVEQEYEYGMLIINIFIARRNDINLGGIFLFKLNKLLYRLLLLVWLLLFCI